MEPTNRISRRDFIKLMGAGAAALSLPRPFQALGVVGRFSSYGRVLEPDTKIFSEPSASSPVVKVYWKDAVLPIENQVDGEQTGEGSWFYLPGVGYVQTELIQPVRFELQEPDGGISRQGSLAEVTVPYAAARYQPSFHSQQIYRYYYSSIHWVNKLIYDRYGRAWYRVKDDKYPDHERWVLASRLRIIPADELAPISPDVPSEEKRILVNLSEQTVTAYEFGDHVFSAAISSGDEQANPKYQTPLGTFWVGFKRPSQHMLPWDQTFGDYDLPGVPWVCYFSLRAHAFHGAYWHNGFGSPRSHGCVNLTPQDARWIYCWTTPVVRAHDDMEYTESGGTIVEVVA
jgi:lipoprotein-anchoring transpeptidase ErfK/SrfK